LAYRGSVEGVIAFAKAKKHALQDLKISQNPLLLIAESPEKPGNLGAILRTADAAGIDAVIVADAKTDLYNPNVLRSSLGCAMTVPVAICSTEECITFCQSRGIHIYASTLQSSQRYDTIDYAHPTAIAMGTEATGISQAFRDAASANIIIPMHGVIDSMNLSASAAILIYEAVKQRGFK
jgi:TrmH family RNA methyltransferase